MKKCCPSVYHVTGHQLFMLIRNLKEKPLFLNVTDHDSVEGVLSLGRLVSSGFSRWLCNLHKGPAVHRDIKNRESGQLAPEPVLRCRKCYTAFKQPAGFPVLPLCCVALRCKCNLMIDNSTVHSCNVSHVYHCIITNTYRNNFSCTR